MAVRFSSSQTLARLAVYSPALRLPGMTTSFNRLDG
jgi:hypothetical protein